MSEARSVECWTGADARCLRQALRMTVQGFADHVGVSPRTVSKWESRGTGIEPLPELQAALDTVLSRADDAARNRFKRAGPAALTIAIVGSRSSDSDPHVIDDVIPALAELVMSTGWRVNHGPVGIGIEVMTFMADTLRPTGLGMTPSLFGRHNVVRGADYALVIGGGEGTALEVSIALANGVKLIPYPRTGGTAARCFGQPETRDQLLTWAGPDGLADCHDGRRFVTEVRRLITTGGSIA